MAAELQTSRPQTPAPAATRHIALAGNPNAGKTTLFNALTGMRQKVGNYPGVTVEKKEGRCTLPEGAEVVILDLPGTYSLSPKSPDEEIARDVLLGLRSDTPVPDAVIVVVDASNLERNLYMATQVLELGIPTVVVLNMTDVALANGKAVDARQLSKELGAPVVETVAARGQGLDALRGALATSIAPPQSPGLTLPQNIEAARVQLAQVIESAGQRSAPEGVALRLLSSNVSTSAVRKGFGPLVEESLQELRTDAALAPLKVGAAEAQARYAMLGGVVARSVKAPAGGKPLSRNFSDRADAILTHKFFGMAIFALITMLVFSAIFSWASYPMDLIDGAMKWMGDQVSARMAEGPLRDLIVQGVIAGVGAVVIFLPQIMILFFFIGILEDSGYMARAAFLMDRMMSKVGLHGRAFIPLMSSFACSIPGIMATRTISNRRDRMTTILIAPLMSCSARIPVYTLMIATFIPNVRLWGFMIGGTFIGLTLPVVVLFSMYALGVVAAMAMAWLFKRTLFKGPPPALMLELPPYKIPAWRNVLVTMWERGSQFLRRAGTIILAISIVLWFLLSYPKVNVGALPSSDLSPAAGIRPGPGTAPPIANEPSSDSDSSAEEKQAALQARHSYAGRLGHFLEPAIAPLGFNWKIGIGLIGAMSAREVFVSTMGNVYAVGDADETSQPLQKQMMNDRWPNGQPVWTPLVAVSLLVYFVLAMQCISTLAVVKRETNSWKWPLFMQVYMTALAWGAAFVVYQGGKLLGWG
jgi:ferrous iron transport protein B